jgi:hypothetical protein
MARWLSIVLFPMVCAFSFGHIIGYNRDKGVKMSARTSNERLNEKADEVLEMLERMIESTTCDQFQCGNPAVWGILGDDYPECMAVNDCTKCEAVKLVKWIKGES